MTQTVFKGFKVELASVFNQLSTADKLNYMWLVRNDEDTNTGKIYFGSRLYSGEATTEDFEVLKEKIENLDIKIDAVNIRVDAEDTRITALNEKIDVIDEKIDIVKEQSSVIYQKIDDIYDDSNRVREDVEKMKVEVADAVAEVNNLGVKLDGEVERAKEAELKNASDIATVNTNLVTAVETINKNVADGFNTINGGIATEIEERKQADAELEANKVSYLSADDKRIVLDNHKNLLGKTTEGNTYNLAMVSQWDVADFGTPHLPFNINSSVIPTVQLLGQTGAEAKHIALAEDVVATDEELKSMIKAESERAGVAESNLQANINDNRNALVMVEKGLATAIDNEAKRAGEAESNLQTNINDNRNALVAVENGLTTAIDNEVKRASEAESNLQAGINDNRNALVAVQTSINAALGEEINRAKEAEKVNAQAIVAETTRASQAEGNLQLNINQVYNTISVVTETMNQSITNLVNSDAKLQANIDAEATTRSAADTQLQADLQAEGVTARAAEKANADAIAAVNTTIDSEIRPAIQKLEDEKVASVELVQDATNQLHYDLMVDGENAGSIDIPKDQFLKSAEYNADNKQLIFVFETETGETTTTIDVSNLVDTYTAGNGLELTSNVFSIKIDPTTQKYVEVSENGLKIVGVDEAILVESERAKGVEEGLRTDVDKLRTDVDYESTRALEAEANINKELANKVNFDESKTKIVLPSGGQLVGTKFGSDGSNPADGAVIAQLSQYDVMNFGSTKYPLNLNVPAGVRPTVQEQGQSGADANKIAYVSDVEKVITDLQAEVTARGTADTQLQADLQTEATTARAAEKANAEAIAENADNIRTTQQVLDTNVNALSGLTQTNADEIARVELEYKDAINQEHQYTDTVKQSLEQADKTNSDAIAAEVTRATEAEKTNSDAIAALEEADVQIKADVTTLSGKVDTITTDLDTKANKSDIPTALPNPNALTINFNGAKAFSYDGSSVETGNFNVYGNLIPINEGAASGDTIESAINAVINAVTVEEERAKDAEQANTDSITDVETKIDAAAAEYQDGISKLQATIANLTARIEALEAAQP